MKRSLIKYHLFLLKKGNKTREITIYDKNEIQLQREQLSKYESLFENHTYHMVHSYRKGHSNWTAIREIDRIKYKYQNYYQCDIRDYFHSINRKLLRKQLSSFISSNEVKNITEYLFCCRSGISEGSPLSPAISNLVLFDFDTKAGSIPDTFYLRYGDDILFLTNKSILEISSFVDIEMKRMKYELNSSKKHRGCIEDGFDYLGFHISPKETVIKPEKVKNILDKIKKEKDPAKIQKILQGWKSYCQDAKYLPKTYEAYQLSCLGTYRYLDYNYYKNIETGIMDKQKMEYLPPSVKKYRFCSFFTRIMDKIRPKNRERKISSHTAQKADWRM